MKNDVMIVYAKNDGKPWKEVHREVRTPSRVFEPWTIHPSIPEKYRYWRVAYGEEVIQNFGENPWKRMESND